LCGNLLVSPAKRKKKQGMKRSLDIFYDKNKKCGQVAMGIRELLLYHLKVYKYVHMSY
jgi:hypothetical protein|tara:strand:- start:762 stop:935 length:174 start_codon:yes stop_codon:yes gene_type:complete